MQRGAQQHRAPALRAAAAAAFLQLLLSLVDELRDLAQLLLEAQVQQAVGLVQDQPAQLS